MPWRMTSAMDKPKAWDARRTSRSRSGGTDNGYVSRFMEETCIILPACPHASRASESGTQSKSGNWLSPPLWELRRTDHSKSQVESNLILLTFAQNFLVGGASVVVSDPGVFLLGGFD